MNEQKSQHTPGNVRELKSIRNSEQNVKCTTWELIKESIEILLRYIENCYVF